jgi:hypothetical protein
MMQSVAFAQCKPEISSLAYDDRDGFRGMNSGEHFGPRFQQQGIRLALVRKLPMPTVPVIHLPSDFPTGEHAFTQ